MSIKIPIETSARHLHISQEDFEKLFGEGSKPHFIKELSQPGQYLCRERVTVKGPKGTFENMAREFDSWISEKSTCRSHKTCFFCVKFLVFIYCILLQCVVKYNKGGILHASYYIEI